MDATEALLEDAASFERVSIQQIARRAGVAAGSFYTRFPDKNAVLTALFARYLDHTERLVAEAEASITGQPILRDRIQTVVRLMVQTFRRRRGVSRAAQLHYLGHPEQASPQMRSRLGEVYERLAKLLLGDGEGVDHEDPLFAARFSIQIVASICRTKILFTDHPLPDSTGTDDPRADDDRLIEELGQFLSGYLCPRLSTVDPEDRS